LTGRRVTIVTSQLAGYDPAGGVGTATAFLALALARMGHDIVVLYVGVPARPLDEEWEPLYSRTGVNVRLLPSPELDVEPRRFQRIRAVELALRADPPDVVIAHEHGGPAYSCLRLRRLSLAFEATLFVVFCHGTRRWVKEMNRNERVSREVLAQSVLEQASAELADVVVSPSAYMIEWMRQQGWQLPEATLVIPLLTRSAATGEETQRGNALDRSAPLERLAFFGRLEEGKGVQPFVEGLNLLPPTLLEGIELEFIGKPTKHWSPERVRGLLSKGAKRTLAQVSFSTDLDQQDALVRLNRPGTLAVMPSLGDNSPNAVYECLELGIPFLASTAGGAAELVAPADRERVLVDPSAAGVSHALQQRLEDRDGLRAARPAFDAKVSLERWANVMATPAHVPEPLVERSAVDVVVVERSSPQALARCVSAVEAQTDQEVRLIVSTSRLVGLESGGAPWVVFLDEEDLPDRGLVETLVRAQAASGADVVTCAVRRNGSEHFYVGEPGGLGLLENEYGTVALIRRALLEDLSSPWAVADVDWPLLARFSAAGARIVSVPVPLVSSRVRPGTLEREPSDGLLVVERFEHALPEQHRSLARMAAGLAAEAQRRTAPSLVGRRRRALRRVAGFLR
jgi:O-antigen biosynthesis protein